MVWVILLPLIQETFAEYTAQTAFERPLLSGVAYAQRVVHSEREEFEREHGWRIRTMEEEPSPITDEYAPVILSQETVSYIKSLDMMSGEVMFPSVMYFMILDLLIFSEIHAIVFVLVDELDA